MAYSMISPAEEEDLRRAYVDWRLGTIGGGADEVMKEVVAKLLKI